MLNKKYLLLIVAIGVFVLYIATTIFFILINKPLERPGIEPTEAPLPTKIVTQPEAKTKPPVKYDEKGTETLLDIIKERRSLTQEDSAAKASLITSLGNQPGVLVRTETFQLYYAQAGDLFQSEILTTDVTQAKMDTASWLSERGLSKDGICNLPLFFYLSRDVALQLGKLRYTFSPLPEGC